MLGMFKISLLLLLVLVAPVQAARRLDSSSSASNHYYDPLETSIDNEHHQDHHQDQEVEEGSIQTDLRVLTFGTSHTFGASLENRYADAYPWRLSPHATNLALRANGPSYPAVCTESMVGDDDIFDVIILEYHLRAEEGLLILARRLRERFPDALIIFFKIWHPFYIHHLAGGDDNNNNNKKKTAIRVGKKNRTEKRGQNFVSWAQETLGPDVSLHGRDLKDALLSTKEEDWAYGDQTKGDQAVEVAAKAVGGYIYELQKNPSPLQAMIHHNHWFADDFHHMSKYGHQVVANDVGRFIKKHGRRSDRVGSWGGGDACLSWFTDGHVGLPYGDDKVRLAQFGDEKYALEFPSSGGGGSVEITNPFDHDRTLYLTYMATGPAPSKYPKTNIIVTKQSEDPSHAQVVVMLDPISSIPDGHGVHVAKLSKAGVVPPGTSIIHIHPLEKTERPFRLTGISLTSDIDADFEVFGDQK